MQPIQPPRTLEEDSSPEIRESNETFREMIKFFRDFIIILLIVIMIRSFVMTPFRINGQSMEPSYFDKEYILVNKWSYLDFSTHFEEMRDPTQSGGITNTLINWLEKIPVHNGDPKRGDVVVVKPHVDMEREFYIKRVVGVPGDTIRIADGKVFLKTPEHTDFVELNEPYLGINAGKTYLPQTVKEEEFVIPAGKYWIMGDNRQNSADSRSCFVSNCSGRNSTHFIKRSDIVGSVLVDF